MTILRSILLFLTAIAMLALGAMFAVQNDVAVPLDLLLFALPERSLALWVLLAFALGGVIGMLTSLGVTWRLRIALRSAQRKLDQQTPAEEPTAAPENLPAESEEPR
jgi:uncharacterized membrane protein YciS (DUF1049 family)